MKKNYNCETDKDDFIIKNKTIISLTESGITKKHLTIPDGIKAINTFAFCDSVALESISLPKSLKTIVSNAFNNCKKLKRITICSDNPFFKVTNGNLYSADGKTLVLYAKGKASNSFTIPSQVEKIREYALFNCGNLRNILFTKNSNLKVIEECGLAYCENLCEIKLPASLEKFSKDIFLNCPNLTKIDVDETSKKFKSIGGNLYSKSGNKFILYACGKKEKSFEIAKNVTTIDKQAFLDAENLETITFEENSTLKTIDEKAFLDCLNLRNIEFPKSLKNINYDAFVNCINLEKIVILNTIEYIGPGAFIGCDKLKSVIFKKPSKITNIYSSTFAHCYNLKEIEIPKTVTEINFDSFAHCESLENVLFESGSKLSYIGKKAFSGCNNLELIILPNRSVTFGESPFEEKTKVIYKKYSKKIAK